MLLIAATHNQGKVRELQAILGELGYEVITQEAAGISVSPVEDADSFEGNALIKARAVAELCKEAVIADDSGLCVDALGGAPGVYSARYAGENATDEENNQKLLAELSGIENRAAKYVAALVLILPDGREFVERGEVCGQILKTEEGTGGFGYDPLFFSDELKMSFGVATPEAKNAISHRGRALQKVYQKLKEEME
ncbi:MAG: RdgB/HAM1 family non-canonical purine NTP pyrophosphatase [Ruminococcaceae bacterium]|nr:RdgB/HAM1 family non-canonical purine NTP pyrophosphatase [Oscillospiraceae bacterium]